MGAAVLVSLKEVAFELSFIVAALNSPKGNYILLTVQYTLSLTRGPIAA